MKFPNKYKCLKNQSFEKGKYKIVPVRYKDRFDIMKWRNDQIYHLRQEKLLTKDDQNQYFNLIIKNLFSEHFPKQILFSYIKNNICIGYGGLVHINWKDKNAEISFIMNTDLENNFKFHWETFLNMLEKVAFEDIILKKVFTYAFDLRPHLYIALEKCGYIKEAELKEHFLFEKKFKSVVIHSKFNTNGIRNFS